MQVGTAICSVICLLVLLQGCFAQSNIRNVSQLISDAGYPVENYWFETSDGFYLSVIRIPGGRNSHQQQQQHQQQLQKQKKPVVFLQHGLLDSACTWILNTPEEALGFLFADAGFDVFLGNVRGNMYSNRNKYYDQNSAEFWNLVDFDNMIAIDLPTMINNTLEITGASSLTYVGHSQGTIMGFGAFPLQPELAAKVNIFIALAPVAFVNHQTSILLNWMADLNAVEWLFYFGYKDFLPEDWLLELLAGTLCKDIPFACADVVFLLCGFDESNLNYTRLPLYMTHTPAGTSVRNMKHWSQAVTSGKFAMFDYGEAGNIAHYGQKTPPNYRYCSVEMKQPTLQDLVHPPVAMFTGSRDDLADPTDILQLVSELPDSNKPVFFHNEETYEHLDFTWGVNAHIKIYPDVISLAKKYSAQK